MEGHHRNPFGAKHELWIALFAPFLSALHWQQRFVVPQPVSHSPQGFARVCHPATLLGPLRCFQGSSPFFLASLLGPSFCPLLAICNWQRRAFLRKHCQRQHHVVLSLLVCPWFGCAAHFQHSLTGIVPAREPGQGFMSAPHSGCKLASLTPNWNRQAGLPRPFMQRLAASRTGIDLLAFAASRWGRWPPLALLPPFWLSFSSGTSLPWASALPILQSSIGPGNAQSTHNSVKFLLNLKYILT